MKKIMFIPLVLLFTAFSFANDDNVSNYVNMDNPKNLVNPDNFFEYMIVKGDCLWFIADNFYSDPFKWRKIHEANPYIIDANWIYPNNWLVIPNIFTDENGTPIFSAVGPIDSETDKLTEQKGIAIDLDGDGVIDGVDLDGDSMVDETANIDIDGDGIIDGYDIDGDGNIDIKSEVPEPPTTTVIAATDSEMKDTITYDKSSIKSYCGKPGWKIGLHAGFPVDGGPEDENLNLGLLLGTPLGVKVGPLSVGLGAGAFTYDFDNYYIGGGLLASLCINDLLKLDIPLIFQLHGVGFYILGEDQGLGLGAIGSGRLPIGKSPFSIGLYGGFGKYDPNESDYNWSNIGAVLIYTL